MTITYNNLFKGVITILLLFILIGSFGIDVGINSKFFIVKHFNQAFQYRITGDCKAFSNFTARDIAGWREKCESEKNSWGNIVEFDILNTSHKFGSDRAFLQVQLKRDGESSDYVVHYEMVKRGVHWLIDQDIQ